MRVKPEVVVQILLPNDVILIIRVPDHRAKFGDDRLRIVDARVVTDGHSDTRTHILLVLYLLHAIHCIVKQCGRKKT